VVAVDESFYGRLKGQPKNGRRAWSKKNVVLTLVEPGGSARSFHVDGVRIGDLQPILRANLSRESKPMTDEMYSYKGIGREFASHDTVNRSKDCSRQRDDQHG
jgi:ISXO2-like transposase domain